MKFLALLIALFAASEATAQRTFIRINQLGYLPLSPKVAVACSLDSTSISTVTLPVTDGRVVYGPRQALASGS
jgi:hypothetical protein